MPASDLKGKLLLEEPKYNSRAKQSRYYQYALGLMVTGVMMGILGFYLRFFLANEIFTTDDLCVGPLMLIIISLSFIFIMFSVYFYLLGKRRMGIKIYENGISYPSSLGFKEVFYPYGDFKSFQKQENFLRGSIYVFDLGGKRSLGIKQKSMDLDRHVDYIRSQIDSPRQVTEVDLVSEKRDFRRAETIWYLLVAGLALVLTLIIAGLALPEWSLYTFILVVGFLGPIMINTAIFILGLRFVYELKSKSWGFGINLKMVGAVFGVSLLIFFAALYATWYLEDDLNTPDIVINDYPGPSELNGAYYEGVDIYLDGDLTLLTGNLTIIDCNVIFNCTEHGEYGLWTGEGTQLTLVDSVIKSRTEDATFKMELQGSAVITGCEFYYIWGDTRTDHRNGEGGLQIHNDDVRIEDCLISEGRTNGILIDHCSPFIINNTIENCDDDGIEAVGGEAYIYGNRIQDNPWGICAFDGCAATIDSNAFIRCDFGLSMVDSELTVTNNHFYKSGDAALYGDTSTSTFRNNEYIGKSRDPGAELLAQSWDQICLIFFFLTTLISFLILFAINRGLAVGQVRKRKKK